MKTVLGIKRHELQQTYKAKSTALNAITLEKDKLIVMDLFHASYSFDHSVKITYKFAGTSTANLALTFSLHNRSLINPYGISETPVIPSLTASPVDLSAAVTTWTAITLASSPTDLTMLDHYPLGKVLEEKLSNFKPEMLDNIHLCFKMSGATVPDDAVLHLKVAFQGNFYNG